MMRTARAFPLLIIGLLALVGLSACQSRLPWEKPSLGQKVAEPPLVPKPPVLDANALNPDDLKPAEPYLDVFGLPEDERVRLKEVLKAVLDTRVFPTPPSTVQFEPDKPITYGELARWNAAFENQKLTRIEPEAASTASSASAPSSSQKEPVLKETLLLHQGVALTPESKITRQQWAVLYAKLTAQKTLAMKEESALMLAPAGVDKGQTFGQFKDVDNISSWARVAVALAYRDKALEEVLGLTPEQLIVDTGFQPQRPLTRAEALLFLYRVHQPLSR